MRILVAGSKGMVGSALIPLLEAEGHEISRLVRSEGEAVDERHIHWDPMRGGVEAIELEDQQVVINLAGENIAAKRWSASQKEKLRASRVMGTKGLTDAFEKQLNPPQLLINASAIGIYGNRGEEVLSERSENGHDFLAELGQQWEGVTEKARQMGIRVVLLRFGVILSPNGGALAKMLTPFKMGVGGILGSGKQYMSWVTLDDVVAVIRYAINNDIMSGPYNVVSPNPVTNEEFTKTLGKVLNRSTFLSMPAFAAKVAFGEMADALLLASQRVIPKRLQESHYKFKHTKLEDALRHVLGLPDGQ